MNITTKNTSSLLKILQLIVLGGIILYFGRTLLIPLSFAVLISFVLFPVCKWLEQHKFSRIMAILTSLCLLLVLIGAVVSLFFWHLSKFRAEWPALKEKLILFFNDFQNYIVTEYGISLQEQVNLTNKALMNASGKLVPFLGDAVFSSSVFIVLLILIPFYIALILFYRNMLVNFLYRIFPEEYTKDINKTLHETVITYYNYIKGMALVYLIVAVLNSIGLAILGIKHAVFFGIMASVLTFIPFVGITIGALLPIAVAWISYDSVLYPIGVIVVFSIVQYLEAYFIFPLAVGFKLRVNALASIIALMAGGVIWGASGMILFLPFIAILKLIADKTESLKPLSILLSSD